MKPRPLASVRALLKRLHLLVGIVLCVPLALIGLTGSALVLEHPLHALLAPAPQRAPSGGAEQPADAIVAAALRGAPLGALATSYAPARGLRDFATVRIAVPGGSRGGSAVRVDPVTLATARDRDALTPAFRQIESLHANALAGRTGRTVVGWIGVVMLLLGVTGVVVWFPHPRRWRAALAIRRKARGFALAREIHGTSGTWSIVVFLVLAFSGVDLAFPQQVAAAVHTLSPSTAPPACAAGASPGSPGPKGASRGRGGGPGGRGHRRRHTAGDAAPGVRGAFAPSVRGAFAPGVRGASAVGMRVGAAVDAALAAVPGARVESVVMPPAGAVRVVMVGPGDADGAPTTDVLLDRGGRVLCVRDPRVASLGDRVVAWLRPLHSGAGLGPVWTGLAFLGGLVPVVFAVTGIAMRRARRGRSA